jgi:predicted GIY-YIG superfamily endonuclease
VQKNKGAVKIGVTNDLKNRIKNVQTGNDDEIYCYYYQEREDAYKVETLVKKKFKKFNTNGEWFEGVEPKEIKLFLLISIF